MLATDIDDPFEVTHGASGVCEADFTVLHESRARIAADVAATASAAAAAAAAEAPPPPPLPAPVRAPMAARDGHGVAAAAPPAALPV